MNQRKAYLLREGKHESWETIAGKVVNLQGEHPCWGTVRNIVSEFNVSRGHRQYNSEKSGRKPWKLPIDVQRNFSTWNQQLLHIDDFLSHHESRVVVRRQAGVI